MSTSLAEPDALSALDRCPSLTGRPMTTEEADGLTVLLKALADPVRLRLLSLVVSHEGGEACVCDLTDAFDLSQPTISHHLKVLHEAGLLQRAKRGVWVYYRVHSTTLRALGRLVASAGA